MLGYLFDWTRICKRKLQRNSDNPITNEFNNNLSQCIKHRRMTRLLTVIAVLWLLCVQYVVVAVNAAKNDCREILHKSYFWAKVSHLAEEVA